MKEAPQGQRPIRGNDNPTIAEIGYNSKIPSAAFSALEREVAGLLHGVVSLSLHIKDGHLIRYTTSRECSFVPGRLMTGSLGDQA